MICFFNLRKRPLIYGMYAFTPSNSGPESRISALSFFFIWQKNQLNCVTVYTVHLMNRFHLLDFYLTKIAHSKSNQIISSRKTWVEGKKRVRKCTTNRSMCFKHTSECWNDERNHFIVEKFEVFVGIWDRGGGKKASTLLVMLSWSTVWRLKYVNASTVMGSMCELYIHYNIISRQWGLIATGCSPNEALKRVS